MVFGWKVIEVASHSVPASAQPKAARKKMVRLAASTRTPTDCGGVLVVADRLHRGAERGRAAGRIPAPAAPPSPPAPSSNCRRGGLGAVGVERDHRHAGLAVDQRVEIDEEMRELRHHPHADRELAAAQPQHEQRDRQRRRRRAISAPSTSAG